MPATRLPRSNRKSVAPCRRPITRPVTTKPISVRVSSLACARSSHRANKNRRESAPAAAAARAEPKPHGIPAATPKRFSPSPFKKRFRVTAPGRTVFNSPRARPLSPALRSELQTDRPWRWRRIRATQFLRPRISELPNTGDGQQWQRRRRAIFQTRARRGLVLARNAPSIVQPVCACQCIARPVPSALHIDSARQAWGLCA